MYIYNIIMEMNVYELEQEAPPQKPKLKCGVCNKKRSDVEFRPVIMRNECIVVMMMCGWCYISDKYHYLA